MFPGDQYELQGQTFFGGWEMDGDDFELEVEADGGTIILQGDVENAVQFRRAIQVARNAPGVRSVDTTGLRIDRDYWAGYYGHRGFRGYPGYYGRDPYRGLLTHNRGGGGDLKLAARSASTIRSA